MTSGDGFEFDAALLGRQLDPAQAALIRLGERRTQEARSAARALGVPPDHLFFLGYPDGGLLHLFLENYAAPYTSPTTGLSSVPRNGTLAPGSAYTGQNFERDVGRVVARVKPDVVLAPAPQDAHPDHRATSYVALRLLAEQGAANKLRFWVVHGGLEWPLPKGLHPGAPLTLPPGAAGLAWQRLDLTPDQVQLKVRAIRVYTTQTRVMNRFLLAFARRNELLSGAPLPRARPGAGF